MNAADSGSAGEPERDSGQGGRSGASQSQGVTASARVAGGIALLVGGIVVGAGAFMPVLTIGGFGVSAGSTFDMLSGLLSGTSAADAWTAFYPFLVFAAAILLTVAGVYHLGNRGRSTMVPVISGLGILSSALGLLFVPVRLLWESQAAGAAIGLVPMDGLISLGWGVWFITVGTVIAAVGTWVSHHEIRANVAAGVGDQLSGQELTWRAFLLPAGALLALFGVFLAIWFVFDKQASANTAAVFFDLIGDSAEADLLRAGSGNQTAAKFVLAAVALALGIGGIWLFYTGLNWVVMRLSPRWRSSLLPWVFVGPALALLAVYLVWPLVRTVTISLTEDGGLANWEWALTAPANHQMYVNNVLWLVVGVAGSVGLGLLVAALFDRVRFESAAKTFVFLPLAISLVGASVIWNFVYAWRPEGANQIGLLNAFWTGLGQDPVAWVQTPDYRLNTFALIVILIWLQTGFAMVVLSAAIKGVPTEITEAASLDGATERQKFLRVIVPMIRGSLVMVTITTAIVVLKVFDIVFVMTGGRFNSDVVANQMYVQAFQFFNDGRGAVLATVLFLAVLPMALVNVRNIRRQGMAA